MPQTSLRSIPPHRPTPPWGDDMAIALTIAGSDSGGGAGIQADLKTFSALGVYGASALTAVTAQNTRAVTRIEGVSPAMIRAQIAAVLDDLDVAAVGGGFARVSPALLAAARAALDRRTAFDFVRRTRIVPSRLSDEGPLIGAAALVHRSPPASSTPRSSASRPPAFRA